MQKRLNSSSADQKAGQMAEVGRLQGALQQAHAEYKQLLQQCSYHQQIGDSSKGRVGWAELQAANKALTQELAESEQHLTQTHQQLHQSQQQLQQYVQETSKLQELVEKLSTAVADMHGAVQKAECLGQQKQGAMSSNVNNNLQAVHDAVQRNLSRYNSSSSERTFASSEILLPALWKPQRERHIAPTGFQ